MPLGNLLRWAMPGTWTQRRLPGRGDTGICRFGVGEGQALQAGAACISPSPPAVPTGDRPSVGSVQPSQMPSGPHRRSLTCDTFSLPPYCKTSKCRCLPNLWRLVSLLPRVLPPVSRSFLWILRDSLSLLSQIYPGLFCPHPYTGSAPPTVTTPNMLSVPCSLPSCFLLGLL